MEGVKSPEVVVIGNVGVDTNVYLPGGDVDWSVEANFTETLDSVGQAGGYASHGYARLGRRTAFIGHLGDDPCGAMVREAFTTDGIDQRGLFLDPTGTARSVNIMYGDGRRKNFYDGKGHACIRPDLALCRSVMSGAHLAHVNIPDWARHLLPVAKDLGLTVACDVQDLVDPDDPYRADFIRQADILFFSAANHFDPSSIIRAFLQNRPDQIILAGMGSKGCLLGTREGLRFFPPESLDRPVVDTNGAGDALAVGFLSGYVLMRRPLTESVRRGQIAARHACTLKGTSSGLITAQELEARLQNNQPLH